MNADTRLKYPMNIPERIISHMPTYHNRENWKKRGKATITPFEWYRNIPILKNIIPYHVGDVVIFYLHIDKPNQSETLSHHVFEKFSNNKLTQLPYNINIDGVVKVTGNIISAEGDVTYSIGFSERYGEPQDIIFHTKVNSWDTIFQNWAAMIVSALLGGIISIFVVIVTGLVKINEDGYLLIPKWLIEWLLR